MSEELVSIPKRFIKDILNIRNEYEPIIPNEIESYFENLLCPNGNHTLIVEQKTKNRFNGTYYEYESGYDPIAYYGMCSVCDKSLWSDFPANISDFPTNSNLILNDRRYIARDIFVIYKPGDSQDPWVKHE